MKGKQKWAKKLSEAIYLLLIIYSKNKLAELKKNCPFLFEEDSGVLSMIIEFRIHS